MSYQERLRQQFILQWEYWTYAAAGNIIWYALDYVDNGIVEFYQDRHLNFGDRPWVGIQRVSPWKKHYRRFYKWLVFG